MKVIKVMNFSGAGEPITFFTFIWRGLERPVPAAVPSLSLGQGDALGLARRVEGVLTDTLGGSFLA
jgi:hypothetical protein